MSRFKVIYLAGLCEFARSALVVVVNIASYMQQLATTFPPD